LTNESMFFSEAYHMLEDQLKMLKLRMAWSFCRCLKFIVIRGKS